MLGQYRIEDVLGLLVVLVLGAISVIANALKKARQRAQEGPPEPRRAPPPPVPSPQPPPLRRQEGPGPRQVPPRVLPRQDAEYARLHEESLRAARAARLSAARMAAKRPLAAEAVSEAAGLSVPAAAGLGRGRLARAPDAAEADEKHAAAEGMAAHLSLGDWEQLVQAIIYHEVFSPPKALRRDRELWDM